MRAPLPTIKAKLKVKIYISASVNIQSQCNEERGIPLEMLEFPLDSSCTQMPQENMKLETLALQRKAPDKHQLPQRKRTNLRQN